MGDLVEQLDWRGFIAQLSDPTLREHFLADSRSLYVGFDPTADSLHVGHMVPVMALAHAQKCGHRPVVLVGGGTGLIGDPSGKTAERQLLSKEEVARNCEGIRAQLSRFMDFSGSWGAILVNNADWLLPLGLLDFLRDIGKHFSVNTMIAREAVRRRLEDREQGISFTEFSYALLQSYDFLHLFQHYGCTVQAGGNDQWGNIVAGIDLIRRVCAGQAFGLTFPLLLTATGDKFGKTEAGAVWLDSKRTSPYQMYQFWFNTADADAGRFLRLFTFLERDHIDELAASHAADPGKRSAQTALATEFTRLVHGDSVVRTVQRATSILFGGQDDDIDDATLNLLSAEIPHSSVPIAGSVIDLALLDLLVETGLAESKGAGRRLVEAGGVYVNNRRRADPSARIRQPDLLCGRAVLLRSGKKTYHLVEIDGI